MFEVVFEHTSISDASLSSKSSAETKTLSGSSSSSSSSRSNSASRSLSMSSSSSSYGESGRVMINQSLIQQYSIQTYLFLLLFHLSLGILLRLLFFKCFVKRQFREVVNVSILNNNTPCSCNQAHG